MKKTDEPELGASREETVYNSEFAYNPSGDR